MSATVKSKLLLLSMAAVLTAPLLAGCGVITGASVETADGGSNNAVAGLSDEEARTWQKQGFANVDTIEKASALAGFKVATPDYVPEGFYRQKNIIVSELGGGLPESIKPKFTVTVTFVEMFYFLRGDDSIMFLIHQTNGKAGIGGGEPATVCGGKGEKQYLEADPHRKYPSRILILARENAAYSVSIYATLTGPLDEATIEKILCSINPDLPDHSKTGSPVLKAPQPRKRVMVLENCFSSSR